MSVTASATTTIGRPVDDVARYAMDPGHDTEWIGKVRTARQVGGAAFGAGTHVERTARFLGRTIRYVLEIEDHDPPRLLAMRSVEAPFPMRVTYRFAPEGAGTRAEIEVEGSPGGFFGLARPLVRRMVGRNIARDLRRLKARLEPA